MLGRVGESRAGLFPVALEGQFDQAVQKLGVRNAARFPELGIHADGGKARNGIDLVQVDLCRSCDRGESPRAPCRRRLRLGRRGWPRPAPDSSAGREPRRDDKFRTFFDILRLVIIELVDRHDFPRHGSLRDDRSRARSIRSRGHRFPFRPGSSGHTARPDPWPRRVRAADEPC